MYFRNEKTLHSFTIPAVLICEITMHLTILALAGGLLCSLAAVQLQCGPQWKVDAAVEAALAAGDIERARDMATMAHHWRQILEVEHERPDASQSRQGLERITMGSGQERGKESGDL